MNEETCRSMWQILWAPHHGPVEIKVEFADPNDALHVLTPLLLAFHWSVSLTQLINTFVKK